MTSTNNFHPSPVSSLPAQPPPNDHILSDRTADGKSGTFAEKQLVDASPSKPSFFKPESAKLTPPKTEVLIIEQVNANCNTSGFDHSPKVSVMD